MTLKYKCQICQCMNEDGSGVCKSVTASESEMNPHLYCSMSLCLWSVVTNPSRKHFQKMIIRPAKKKKKKKLLKNCFLLQKSFECDLEITLSNNSEKNIRMFELKSTYNEFLFFFTFFF